MHILSADHPRIQTTGTQDNRQLHQNLKIGDLLKVEIIDSLQKQLRLLLADGTVLEANLEKALDVFIGQQLTLEVKDINGKQIFMEINMETPRNQQADENVGIKNILSQLDIVVTQESEEAVKVLMQKMLPITKENIRQVELGLKASQLPVDTLLTMLENEIPVTNATLSKMQSYENGEIKLQAQIQTIIEDVLLSDNMEYLEKVHTILTDATEGTRDHIVGGNVLDEPRLDSEKIVTNKQVNTDSTISAKAEEGTSNATVEETQSKLLKQGEPFEMGAPKNMEIIKKEVSDMFKELFFVRPEKLKDHTDTKLRNTREFYREIYKVVDELEKTDNGPSQKQGITVYSDIKSNIEFLNIASKYDTMIHIPLIIQNQYKHGELYIFNQKKDSKKNYHEASMLISLETVSLGTVEVYIKKYNKQISCQFKTDHKDIEQTIQSQTHLLQTKLKDKGYDLTTVTYIPSSQTFVSKQNVPNEKSSGRYRFDTKV